MSEPSRDPDICGWVWKMDWESFKEEWGGTELDAYNLPIEMTAFPDEQEIKIVFWLPRKQYIFTVNITDGGSHRRSIRQWYLKRKRNGARE